tara:strand:+ start:355 stop:675 length:321 start_codon:yes stop_codon:yes gene_type:complete
MDWKNTIKKEKDIANERFPDSDRDWMERDAETAFDEDKHKESEAKELLVAITREIDERLDKASGQVHITYKPINEREVKKKLLPILRELVENHLEFDMSKFKYSGP